jgi:hypothetical protein
MDRIPIHCITTVFAHLRLLVQPNPRPVTDENEHPGSTAFRARRSLVRSHFGKESIDLEGDNTAPNLYIYRLTTTHCCQDHSPFLPSPHLPGDDRTPLGVVVATRSMPSTSPLSKRSPSRALPSKTRSRTCENKIEFSRVCWNRSESTESVRRMSSYSGSLVSSAILRIRGTGN